LDFGFRDGWDRPLAVLGRTGPRACGTTRPRPVASVFGTGRLPPERAAAGSSSRPPRPCASSGSAEIGKSSVYAGTDA
jgi:hypothetical protein